MPRKQHTGPVRFWQCDQAADDGYNGCERDGYNTHDEKTTCGWVEFPSLDVFLTTRWISCRGSDCERKVGYYDDCESAIPVYTGDDTIYCSAKCLRRTRAHWNMHRQAKHDLERCLKYAGLQAPTGSFAGMQSAQIGKNWFEVPQTHVEFAWGRAEFRLGFKHYMVSCGVDQWAKLTGNPAPEVSYARGMETPELIECKKEIRNWLTTSPEIKADLKRWRTAQLHLGLFEKWQRRLPQFAIDDDAKIVSEEKQW